VPPVIGRPPLRREIPHIPTSGSTSEEIPEDVQRWTSGRRAALVLSILKGETSVQEATREPGLTVAEIEDWSDRFLLAAENAQIEMDEAV